MLAHLLVCGLFIGIYSFALLVLVVTGLFYLIARISSLHQVLDLIVCPFDAGVSPLVHFGRV